MSSISRVFLENVPLWLVVAENQLIEDTNNNELNATININIGADRVGRIIISSPILINNMEIVPIIIISLQVTVQQLVINKPFVKSPTHNTWSKLK